jgi:hypothetical protein
VSNAGLNNCMQHYGEPMDTTGSFLPTVTDFGLGRRIWGCSALLFEPFTESMGLDLSLRTPVVWYEAE